MAIFVIAKDLEDDLERLFDSSPEEASAADMLLELLYENENILTNVHPPETVHQYTPTFEFKPFQEAQNQGLNVYILKYWDPEHGHLCKHRIFVGHNPERSRYYALTIADRPNAYILESVAFQELVRRYEFCKIPFISGPGRC
jgi:hypothetical protein